MKSFLSKSVPQIAIRILVVLQYVFPIVLLIGASFVAGRSFEMLEESFLWVDHSRRVEDDLQDLYSLLVDAETGQRGYLLTDKEVYLDSYYAAEKKLPEALDRLQDIADDLPEKKQEVDAYRKVIDKRLKLIRESIALAKEGRKEESIAQIKTDMGYGFMKTIREKNSDLIQAVETHLQNDQQNLVSSTHYFIMVLWAIVGVLGLLTLAFSYAIYRLRKMRDFVTVCAWSHTIQYEGEWLSFEEYLHRRFDVTISHGIAPHQAKKILSRNFVKRVISEGE